MLDLLTGSNRQTSEFMPIVALERLCRAGPEFVEAAVVPHIPALTTARHVMLAGMGGSGVPGAIAEACASEFAGVRVVFLREPELPHWAGPDDVLVVVSYSGQTREILELVTKARRVGIQVIGVTTGGNLPRLLGSGGNWLSVADSGPARDAFFSVSGRLFGLLKSSDPTNPLDATSVGAELDAQTPVLPAEAERILALLSDRTPIFIGTGHLFPVAERWCQQFAENAKRLAIADQLPACLHNTVEVLENEALLPVLLRDSHLSPTRNTQCDLLLDFLATHGIPFVEQRSHSATKWGSSLRLIQIGDYISLSISPEERRDDAIFWMKERLASELPPPGTGEELQTHSSNAEETKVLRSH